MMYETEKAELGARIRRLRIQQGLTQDVIAASTGCSVQTLRGWEQGLHAPLPWKLPVLAASLGVPVAQLFTDELVVAEVRVSEGTLQKCRDSGRSAAQEAASRIASQLEPLVWEAATRPAVDVRPGARAARKRMTRAERLAGLRAAGKAQRAARQRSIG